MRKFFFNQFSGLYELYVINGISQETKIQRNHAV